MPQINAVVDRAIRSLKSELNKQFDAVDNRFDGMDKAVDLLHVDNARVPTSVDKAIVSLRELMDEKIKVATAATDKLDAVTNERFLGVKEQFNERDVRGQQLSSSDKTAVNAALAAQEKQAIAQNESNTAASSKSEANFSELIKQGRESLNILKAGFDLQIADIKSRLDKGEGRTNPATDAALGSISTQLAALQTYRDEMGGRSKGTENYTNVIVIVVGLVVAAITIIPTFTKSATAVAPIIIERSATGDKVITPAQ